MERTIRCGDAQLGCGRWPWAPSRSRPCRPSGWPEPSNPPRRRWWATGQPTRRGRTSPAAAAPCRPAWWRTRPRRADHEHHEHHEHHRTDLAHDHDHLSEQYHDEFVDEQSLDHFAVHHDEQYLDVHDDDLDRGIHPGCGGHHHDHSGPRHHDGLDVHHDQFDRSLHADDTRTLFGDHRDHAARDGGGGRLVGGDTPARGRLDRVVGLHRKRALCPRRGSDRTVPLSHRSRSQTSTAETQPEPRLTGRRQAAAASAPPTDRPS